MIEVRLPREGSTTMSSGVVLEWFVEEGSLVQEGDVLVEIETDKVSFEVPAPASGTVRRLVAEAGEEVDVGALLVLIGDADEPLPEPEPIGPSAPSGGSSSAQAEFDHRSTATGRADEHGRVRAAPAARRIARELAVDLTMLSGSGPEGRITSADVRAAATRAGGSGAVVGGNDDPLRGLSGHRGVVARRMAQASAETAAVTLMMRADVTRIARAEGVSLVDVVVHEIVRCVSRHPGLNASLTDAGIVEHERVGLGYAVDGRRGLVVPVIADADVRSPSDLAAERRRLVKAALEGGLSPSDLAGGTFTVTNLGASGIELFTPIITPGQTAVLGLGATVPTVVPTRDGQAFGVRSLIGMSLTFDHRIVDGAEAGRFLGELSEELATWRPEA